MIKSTRNIKEIVRMGNAHPAYAEGHFCLDLTDPMTGKIKKQIKGKNTVFLDQLFLGMWTSNFSTSGYTDYYTLPWNAMALGINRSILALNDAGPAPDPNFPFLMGQTIGYGKPSTGSLGTFRGAYNAANEVLGSFSDTKQRWKFQYDFTTAQANSGTILSAGLTKQYSYLYGGFSGITKHGLYDTSSNTSLSAYASNSGRYSAYISYGSTTGVVTVWDTVLKTKTDVDLVSILGTNSNERKYVGYAPNTGKWYLARYSGTTANRKVWVFSDQTFSNLETTYSVSNFSTGPTDTVPSYIYGNKIYILNGATSPWVYVLDFVANTLDTSKTFVWSSVKNNLIYNEGYTTFSLTPSNGSMGTQDGFFVFNKSKEYGFFYDAVNDTIKTFLSAKQINGDGAGMLLYPLIDNQIPCNIDNITGRLGVLQGALTTYILPEPVTKTSANGMTVTYELEVFW